MTDQTPDNATIADLLARTAEMLDLKQENRYRVRSYADAARVVRQAEQSVAALVRAQGVGGARALPGIGEKLAGAIREIVETGRLRSLERLEAEVSPELPFTRVPGIGHHEAVRIHAQLGVETLEDLEVAAHDGRLDTVEGLTAECVQAIRDELNRMLSRPGSHRARPRPRAERPPAEGGPPVALLLAIDAEYRAKAEAGALRTIAPRRFNPDRERWLPILKTRRGGWSFTALFSNTARAHELGKTRDWVVLYYSRGAGEDQCTVVTGSRGRLRGKRIVRGREDECRDYHEAADP